MHADDDAPLTTTPLKEGGLSRSRRRACMLALIPVALIVLSAWPLIFAQVHRGRMASDQFRYHEVVMRVFARAWPDLNYRDYLSATTPGYHTAIAGVSEALGDDRATLQVLGSLFTLALVAGVALALVRRAPAGLALALTAPVACSMYVWPSAVWLLPDGAGWLGVLAMLALALRSPSEGGVRRWVLATLAPACFVLLGLVFVRQVHVWTAAVLWTGAWLSLRRDVAPAAKDESPSAARRSMSGPLGEIGEMIAAPRERLANAAVAFLATMPAFALLAWFIVLWGGLTPPHFREAGIGQVAHGGANLAAPAYVLAVFGALSPFYLGFIVPALASLVREHRAGVLAIALGAVLISTLPSTTYSQADGRWSGVIWSAVQTMPTIASHTSPVIVLLSLLGGVSLLGWSVALPKRDRWILLAAIIAFTAAQTANHQAWQRYVEPMALIWLALASVRVVRSDSALLGRLRIAGPITLACGSALLCALIVVRGRAFPVEEYDRRVLPLIESGEKDAARAALDEIRRMYEDQG